MRTSARVNSTPELLSSLPFAYFSMGKQQQYVFVRQFQCSQKTKTNEQQHLFTVMNQINNLQRQKHDCELTLSRFSRNSIEGPCDFMHSGDDRD